MAKRKIKYIFAVAIALLLIADITLNIVDFCSKKSPQNASFTLSVDKVTVENEDFVFSSNDDDNIAIRFANGRQGVYHSLKSLDKLAASDANIYTAGDKKYLFDIKQNDGKSVYVNDEKAKTQPVTYTITSGNKSTTYELEFWCAVVNKGENPKIEIK